jgi:hypothetical protein
MILHPPLKSTMTEGSSAAHQKTVHQLVSRLLRNKVPSENRYACSPRKRYSSVINVIKAIRIPETVLRDNDVFVSLAKNANEESPAFDGNVDGHAATKALADACVGPFDTD